MPLMERDHFYFAILFLCIPVQYFVIQYSGSSESSRTYRISQIVKEFQEFHTQWLRPESWVKWLKKCLVQDPGQGECPAHEVLRYREQQNGGHFASSSRPRDRRIPQVKFRVGQVIKHFITFTTTVWFISSVDSFMLLQMS